MAYYQKQITLDEMWSYICECIEKTGYWTENSSDPSRFKVYSSKGESGAEDIVFGFHDHSKRGWSIHAAMHLIPMKAYTPGDPGTYGKITEGQQTYNENNVNFCNYNDWTSKVHFASNLNYSPAPKEKVEITIVVTKDYITAVWYPSKNSYVYLTNGFQIGMIDRINPEDKTAISFLRLSCHTDTINTNGSVTVVDDWLKTKPNNNQIIIPLGTNCPTSITTSNRTIFGYEPSGDTDVKLPLFDAIVSSRTINSISGVRGYLQGIKLPIISVRNKFVNGDIIYDHEGRKYMFFYHNVSGNITALANTDYNIFIELV